MAREALVFAAVVVVGEVEMVNELVAFAFVVGEILVLVAFFCSLFYFYGWLSYKKKLEPNVLVHIGLCFFVVLIYLNLNHKFFFYLIICLY